MSTNLTQDQIDGMRLIEQGCKKRGLSVERSSFRSMTPVVQITNAQGHVSNIMLGRAQASIQYRSSRAGRYNYPLTNSIFRGILREMREHAHDLKVEAEQEAYEAEVEAFEKKHAGLIADLKKHAFRGRVYCKHDTDEIDAHVRLPVAVWKKIQKHLPKADDE